MFLHCLISTALFAVRIAQAAPSLIESSISARAARDGIDLSVLEITPTALSAIADTYRQFNVDYSSVTGPREEKPYARRGIGAIFDVHAHAEPDWYRSLTPFSGGEPLKSTGGGDLVPVWNITAHIAFMNTMGITHSVLGFTGPSANVYMRDRNRTVALARLINEQLAAYARTQPEQFSFFAAMPLPYADDAIKELEYATKELGAVGVALMSNHEGMYLGHDVFTPFWKYMDGMGGRQIVYVHPTTPYIPVNDTFVVANPNPSMETSRMEYYMETARTFTDLTVTQTLQNFTNTHFVLPHLGGAFPVMIDRVLKTRHPELYDSSLAIYRSRFACIVLL
ncbi:amidohydrolase 2 [Coprinopsis cinerea AmutBmut pab1-1]|nr:amidohydrolase 2 [Coprinopsis cinerea AmutBmut pab1-1]